MSGGLSADHPLAAMWSAARTLRLVDGPDEVHLRTLAKIERTVWTRSSALGSGPIDSKGHRAGHGVSSDSEEEHSPSPLSTTIPGTGKSRL